MTNCGCSSSSSSSSQCGCGSSSSSSGCGSSSSSSGCCSSSSSSGCCSSSSSSSSCGCGICRGGQNPCNCEYDCEYDYEYDCCQCGNQDKRGKRGKRGRSAPDQGFSVILGASGNATTVTLPASTATAIQLATSTTGGFTTSSKGRYVKGCELKKDGTFRVPAKGKYHFDAGLIFQSTDTVTLLNPTGITETPQIQLRVNGTTVAYGSVGTENGGPFSGSVIIPVALSADLCLKKKDKVTLWVSVGASFGPAMTVTLGPNTNIGNYWNVFRYA